MLKASPILGSIAVLVLLTACGQRGPLFLPTGEAGASRATLPQTLNPAGSASEPGGTSTGAANPTPHP